MNRAMRGEIGRTRGREERATRTKRAKVTKRIENVWPKWQVFIGS